MKAKSETYVEISGYYICLQSDRGVTETLYPSFEDMAEALKYVLDVQADYHTTVSVHIGTRELK